ncbi:hypothetical protein Asulf_02252 [Archaeoglobus sulfaticallidus PM70-1]|uniref:Uncharacterized protein n=1 Tax=Archaeoglobus sulfaticallidus PM70-1 TaxID=387631 RepID=N0BPC0_9EURY|nr:hypothetical protein [Archaeoglobus sulfaticallidus]AGK62205.1 hypothetical protein Asulf_02252 [Archaeoglobus sulfaticallidus PM70-1]
MEVIPKILLELSGLLGEVVTEEEIKAKTPRAVLRVLGNEAAGIENIEDIEGVVVESLLDTPYSISSPHYSEKLSLNGVDFYHIHVCKPSKDDLEEAYDEYLRGKRFIEIRDRMLETSDSFFQGYHAEGSLLRKYTGKTTVYVFFSLMDYVFEDVDYHLNLAESLNGNYVVIVPTEKTPEKFVKFFKLYSEKAKKCGLKIWVCNIQDGYLDPFIVYPRDLNLVRRFRNPKIASLIASMWRVNVEKID